MRIKPNRVRSWRLAFWYFMFTIPAETSKLVFFYYYQSRIERQCYQKVFRSTISLDRMDLNSMAAVICEAEVGIAEIWTALTFAFNMIFCVSRSSSVQDKEEQTFNLSFLLIDRIRLYGRLVYQTLYEMRCAKPAA